MNFVLLDLQDWSRMIKRTALLQKFLLFPAFSAADRLSIVFWNISNLGWSEWQQLLLKICSKTESKQGENHYVCFPHQFSRHIADQTTQTGESSKPYIYEVL